MIVESNKKNSKNFIISVLLFILIQYPLSSMLKVYIGPLNVVLTGLCFLLFIAFYFKYNIRKIELLLLCYIGLTFVQNLILWGVHYYENNMLFYLPFLILYFCFFARNSSVVLQFFKEHKLYINFVLIVWNAIVLISFFIPSCYVYEGETLGFVSFAGTTFLLSSIAILVCAFLIFQFCMYRNKIYLLAMIIPSLCILLGTTRTYLVVLICAWMITIYVSINNKKKFLPAVIVGSIIFIAIILVSPIKNKFLDTSNRSEELDMDPLEAFTSGRSVFWEYDFKQIISNNILRITFGNGVNYLFYLNKAKFHNPLWAHNDFIQLLGDYGIFGLIIYFYMFKYLIKSMIGDTKNIKKIMGILLLMWIFNAFFNMFYTYFCATLSFPIFLLCIKYDFENRNKDNMEELNKDEKNTINDLV